MAQEQDVKFPADADKLYRFERIADSSAVSEDLSGLLGKAPLFSEFSRDDIQSLADYMGLYRAQPGKPSSAKATTAISCCSSCAARWTS